MVTCIGLQDQLTQAQSQLNKINAKLDDPDTSCLDAGFDPGGDACVLYIKSLYRQQGAVEQNIANLQQEIALCNLFVGTWSITLTGVAEVAGTFTGQLNIIELLSGTVAYSQEVPYVGATSDFIGIYDAQKNFLHLFPPNFAKGDQDYEGNLDVSAQRPIMSGTMTQVLPPGTVGVDPLFNWMATKIS